MSKIACTVHLRSANDPNWKIKSELIFPVTLKHFLLVMVLIVWSKNFWENLLDFYVLVHLFDSVIYMSTILPLVCSRLLCDAAPTSHLHLLVW